MSQGVFGRCLSNGWGEVDFWKGVKIKVDSPVKEVTTDREIKLHMQDNTIKLNTWLIR